MHRQFLQIGLLGLLIGCSLNSNTLKPAPSKDSDNETQVYSAILNERYVDTTKYVGEKAKLLLIADETSPSIERFQEYRKDMRLVSQNTLNDYQSKNEQSYKLSKKFDIGVKYLFIDAQEMNRLVVIKVGIPDWNRFYAKYPDAAGVISFSRIGFNQEFTEALVLVGRGCGRGCGEGAFLFLTKVDGIWKVKDSYGGWMS